MKVNVLWDEFWRLADSGNFDKLLAWVNDLMKEYPSNIDLKYILIEALLWNHLDVKVDQEEPLFTNFCTFIIRDKESQSPITVAKAYTYRGGIKYYAIDRRKDFDKAKTIIAELNRKDTEVKFLNQFISLQYPLHVRQYLGIDTDHRNMFKF